MAARADKIEPPDLPEQGNVIPFVRPPSGEPGSSTLKVGADERPAPDRAQRRALIGPALFVLCSLALHVGLYALFSRPPKPFASVDTVAMSLEIVLGADVA